MIRNALAAPLASPLETPPFEPAESPPTAWSALPDGWDASALARNSTADAPDLRCDIRRVLDVLVDSTETRARACVAADAREGGFSNQLIGAALARIQGSQETRHVLGHSPWSFARFGADNPIQKRQAFAKLLDAERTLTNTTARENTLKRQFEELTARLQGNLAPGTEQATARSALNKTSHALQRATTARNNANTALINAENHLRQVLTHLAPGHASEVNALPLRGHSMERNHYTLNLPGGRSVRLNDNVDAYSTVDPRGLVGHADGDSHAFVANRIAASDLSPCHQRILLGTAANEGTFSSLNGYDKAGLTFGFIQMAGGKNSALTSTLEIMKRQAPTAFQTCLGQYGIDVQNGTLALTRADGSKSWGAEAAKQIGTDPTLASVLSAAGMDPSMQSAQIAYADHLLNIQMNQPTHDAAGASVPVKSLLTSEYAAGLFFDRSVQNGARGAMNGLEKIVHDYESHHPNASLARPETRAAIEAAYIATVEKSQPIRSQRIAQAGASRAANSYLG